MSIECMSAVWRHSTAKGSELLLLLAIADYADEEGWCFPHRRTLAERIRMSGDSVKRLTRALEIRGELEVIRHADEGRGSSYRVVLGAGATCTPPPSTPAPPGGAPAHPPTTLEPPDEPSGAAKAAPTSAGTPTREAPAQPPMFEHVPAKVGTKAVTAAEATLCARILRYWQAKSGYSPPPSATRTFARAIVSRLRDHPELSPEDHKRIIDTAWRDPWWQKNGGELVAGPSVVYGNAKAFANALLRADRPERAPGAGPRSTHTEQARPDDDVAWQRANDGRVRAAVQAAKRHLPPAEDF